MELRILDGSFQTQAIVDTFTSLIWKEKYYETGDFEFVSSSVASIVSLIGENQYLAIDESNRLMVLEEVNINTDTTNGNKITLKGRSIEVILDKRIIWDRTVLTGNLQDGILKLLNENAIDPIDPNRKIQELVFEASTDPSITSLTVETQYETGVSLFTAISELCKSYEISYKIYSNTLGELVFTLYAGADRSYDQTENPQVVFSPEFDNLVKADYKKNTAAFKTTTLVVGVGDGIDKHTVVVEAIPNISGLLRNEIYTDGTQIAKVPNGVALTLEEYLAQLDQLGVENLLKNFPSESLDGEIDPNQTMYEYGVDFFIGDIVQVADTYGHQSKSRVTEFIFSEDENGVKFYPTFTTIQ